MRTVLLIGAMAAAGCSGSSAGAPCPMPTADREREAFVTRVQSMRDEDVAVPQIESARHFPSPTSQLRITVLPSAIRLSDGGHYPRMTREEILASIADVDPLRLGELLPATDGSGLVRLTDGRISADDKQGGETGFLVRPLYDKLRLSGHEEERLGLEVHAAIPFRTLAEVIYSAGQAERSDLELLVRQRGQLRALQTSLPTFRSLAGSGSVGEDSWEEESLNLSVTITAEGTIVAGSGGKLGPGCETVASGRVISVPWTSEPDWTALSACLRKVKTQFPDEASVIVSADPDTPVAQLAQAIAAAAEDHDGELFPVFMLSAGVR